jgi:hypothetical protein
MKMTDEEILTEVARDYHSIEADSDLANCIRSLVARARSEAVEEAAKEVCAGCAAGAPIIIPEYHVDGYGPCRAVAIRALAPRSQDEKEG